MRASAYLVAALAPLPTSVAATTIVLMRARAIRRVPLLLLALTVAFEVASVVLSWGLEPRYDTILYAVFSVTMGVAGVLIVMRHPSNRIGWLFLVFGLLNAAIADAAQGWGLQAAQHHWPGGTVAELVVTTNWLVSGFGWILTFLLFPDGRLRRRRDRLIAIVGAAGAAVALPGWSLSPGIGRDFVSGRNPFAVRWLPTGTLLAVGMTAFLASFVASAVVLVIRFRAARGAERQQLKWFVFAASVAAVVLPLNGILWNAVPAIRPSAAVALTALPLAACVAILRYRLYDIDVVVSRTATYVSLTVVLAATYVTSVVLIGSAAGRRSAVTTAGATLVVAVAFRPLLHRLQAAIDRRFRPAHHAAVDRVAAFLDDLRAERAEPEAIERVLAEALGVAVQVEVRVPESTGWVDVAGRPVDAEGSAGRRWPIVRSGTEIGAVVLATDGDGASRSLPEVLEAAAFVIDVVRLRIALRRQLNEVEASRSRIAAAADDERRRIERDLHDGAQQRLVSIGLALRHAQHALAAEAPAEASRTLDGAVAELTATIEELRELARGIRPAQLERGLAPALNDLAHRVPVPVELSTVHERFPPEIEAAAYFIACEGLTNAVKHAGASHVTLRADRVGRALVVTVADDGAGGARPRERSGLTGLSDRVAALGGILTITSVDGDGTTLLAEFPCGS